MANSFVKYVMLKNIDLAKISNNMPKIEVKYLFALLVKI